MLFSGLDEPPKTAIGRLFAMVLLGTGVGLAGLFTGTVASILVEHQLRRRDVSNFEMEDHLVLCNWGPRGLAWIREVHSKIIQDKRPVVIIHDDTEQIDLPDKQDDAAFNDVYIVKGDPTNEVVLRRARVPTRPLGRGPDRRPPGGARRRQVDPDLHRDPRHLPGATTSRTSRSSAGTPRTATACSRPGPTRSSPPTSSGLRLLARTAIYHGMTRVYQELLTVGRDANEMYLLPVPEELVGRDFVEVSSMFLRYRDDRRLPPDRPPARRADDPQPDRRRGGPAQGQRRADPPEPRPPPYRLPPAGLPPVAVGGREAAVGHEIATGPRPALSEEAIGLLHSARSAPSAGHRVHRRSRRT